MALKKKPRLLRTGFGDKKTDRGIGYDGSLFSCIGGGLPAQKSGLFHHPAVEGKTPQRFIVAAFLLHDVLFDLFLAYIHTVFFA